MNYYNQDFSDEHIQQLEQQKRILIEQINNELAIIDKVREFFNKVEGQYLISYLTHIKTNKLEELINEIDSNKIMHIQAEIKAFKAFESVIMNMENKEETLKAQLMEVTEEHSY